MVPITLAMLAHLYAYIDPASGSILLQVILAGAVGSVSYFFRPIWRFFRVPGRREAAGLLVVRLVFGLGIMLHGWQKIRSPGGPFGWMGPDAHVPAFLQGLATFAEFGGGLGIILGLLTLLASLGLICNMLVALFLVHFPHGDPFVGAPGQPSFEPAAHYLSAALLLLFTGAGAWSLDALWIPAMFHRQDTVERAVKNTAA